MANLPIYNPTAEEGLSAPLGGLSQTLTNIASILNLKTNVVTDLPLDNIFISESDLNRLYKSPLPYNVWLENPAPVIKKNGVVINPNTDGFKIHLMGGLVEFTSMLPNERPLNTDVLTVTATYVTNESSKLETVDGNIAVLTQKIANFRGVYTTKEQLENTIAEPVENDFALVTGTVNDWFVWDNVTFEWLRTDELTLNKKADKKVPVKTGSIATLDGQGNLLDSGTTVTEITETLDEALSKTGDGKDVIISEIPYSYSYNLEDGLSLSELFARINNNISGQIKFYSHSKIGTTHTFNGLPEPSLYGRPILFTSTITQPYLTGDDFGVDKYGKLMYGDNDTELPDKLFDTGNTIFVVAVVYEGVGGILGYHFYFGTPYTPPYIPEPSFVGTQAEWDALSAEQQQVYDEVNLIEV